jgi:hypothetical protein
MRSDFEQRRRSYNTSPEELETSSITLIPRPFFFLADLDCFFGWKERYIEQSKARKKNRRERKYLIFQINVKVCVTSPRRLCN